LAKQARVFGHEDGCVAAKKSDAEASLSLKRGALSACAVSDRYP